MESILSDICQRFGPDFRLKPGQLEALKHVWDWSPTSKHDLLVSLPCGYGKSVIYQVLPDMLARKNHLDSTHSVVVVFCPLNIIITDQLARMRDIGVTACRLDIHGNAYRLTGSEGGEEAAVKLEDISAGMYSLIYLHPESVFQSEKGKTLLQNSAFCSRVSAVVVDECHKVEDWRKNFRKAFGSLDSLVAFFPEVPLIAMSGTLSTSQLKTLPRYLCMRRPVAVVKKNPDRVNIFLNKGERKTTEHLNAYECIYMPECDKLLQLRGDYPVTLLFLPMNHISGAMAYVMSIFNHGDVNIYDPSVLYCPIYSRLDKETNIVLTSELQKPIDQHCRIRLIFCTSVIGMGFDSHHITNIIHSKPPYLMADYFQQIGRAGRCGQPSTAMLWYREGDLKPDDMCPAMKSYARSETECLRSILLAVFGFCKDSVEADLCCQVCRHKKRAVDELADETGNLALSASV